MKKVLIILAEGFEEIEAITPIDLLRRAGLEVTVAGLSKIEIEGSHRIRVHTDIILEEYNDLPDAIILPGGTLGAKHLGESKTVSEIVKKANSEKKVVAAICAAPALALAPAGVLNGKKATCFPGLEENFSSAVRFSEERVVEDGNIVTSRGAGTAMEFSLKLVERLSGKEKAKELKEKILA
jgi:4-methyl-5(b-hydroxyethyl)-thiazole monophosphate biosynthesis